MHAQLDLLTDLAVILCVAAVTTVVFQRIRQPVVLGYLLAGLIVGPHVPVPLFAEEQTAHTLSELGVILLMFSLGLEFSFRGLIRVGFAAGVVALIQCSLMIWLGYTTGRLFGWTGLESLFTGALVAISSTTIIVKAFGERGIKGALADLVFGILVVEDLIAIVLLAVLTPIASGASLSPGGLAATLARLAGFLIGLLVVGMLVVPRLIRAILKFGRVETIVVASVGISFATALLARQFGYSVALGAFLGGALVAESGEAKKIEPLIEPVRDVFAAVFFVSVGMLIDPRLVAAHWVAVVVLTAVVVVGKVLGVALGAFLAGSGVRTSVQAGMSLAQIGEFSFIIVAVGASSRAVGSFLYPVAVAVSALTTLLTPWLIAVSERAASYVDRHLPPALQTYASLYGSWLQGLRAMTQRRTSTARIRRLIYRLGLDLVVLGAIVIVASVNRPRLLRAAGDRLGLDPRFAQLCVVLLAFALAAPFLLGAVRIARALGVALATEALPSAEGGLDLAAAPRRALLVTLQLAILLAAGIPLVAVTQPFLPGVPAFAVVLAGVLALALPLWKSATNLQGHVRAGAQVILEALARQGKTSGPLPAAPDLGVRRLVPGLGEPNLVHLDAHSPSRGRSLRAIDLRASTGATVIAIERGAQALIFPEAHEVLAAGDVLVITGTREAVSAARDLLLRGASASGTQKENGNGDGC